MISATKLTNGGVDLEIIGVQPTVCIDLDSLADIAATPARRDRFLGTLERRGTLLFSWTNLYDLAGPKEGSAQKIREFLRLVGPRWAPLEMNPWKVARKESGEEPSDGTPGISESLMRAYYPKIADGALDLATAVDLVQADREHVLAEQRELKAAATAKFKEHRDRYRADKSSLDTFLPPVVFDAGRPATYMLRSLERLLTSQLGFEFTENDSVDFMHATVGSAYADLLVVDKQWKRRVGAVAPKREYPWLFYRAELDDFLEAFDRLRVGS
jgi:hypothetical protein